MDTSIKRLTSFFKNVVLICVAMFLMSFIQKYKNYDTGNDELIYREIVTHRIVNEELRELITEYDKMYSRFAYDSTSISILCYTDSDRSIVYSVGHTYDIGNRSPTIICEPINGKDIHLIITEFGQVELPQQRRVELLKNSNPKEYEYHKKRQKEIENDPEAADYGHLITNHFVSWEIVFNKFTGECISKSTPDRTKEYRRWQK